MQGHCDRRRDLITSTRPCRRDGKQCFQAPKWCEAKKNPDGGAERDRVRCVRNRHQGHVMLGQPALEPCEWAG
jgi:hypothetical protein